MRIGFGLLLIVVGLSLAFFRGCNHRDQCWEYKNKAGNLWELADKASTIEQKSAYLDAFISKVESFGLSGCNSNLYYQTPSSGFNQNLIALKSLQLRLKKIKNMDENSLAYQTAIEQITAQEQGEAGNILYVIEECYYKKNYYSYWNNWIITGMVILEFGLMIVGIIMIIRDEY